MQDLRPTSPATAIHPPEPVFRPGLGRYAAGLLAAALLAFLPRAEAQSLEPRAYTDVPAGVNFLILGYAYTQGSLAQTLPITNSHLDTSSGVIAFSHSFDLWGTSAKVDANMPYTWLSGHADFQGQTLYRSINGFGDPAFRLSVNLYGAPALTPQEFASYKQDLVIGASLQIVAPLGQYDSTKVVNVGANIWSFKPEIGLSKALGHWSLELQTAVTWFTDNDNLYNGNKRSQDPLYQVQAHVIYGFSHGIWASVDTTYYTGDRSTLNNRLNSDLEKNWRTGGTFAMPINRYNSVKFYVSDGVSARTGNNYLLFGIALQHRWGGGI